MTLHIPRHGIDARRYRCALFPWLKAQSIHHTTYKGPEWLWWDLLPLSKPAHWLIHCPAAGRLIIWAGVRQAWAAPTGAKLQWPWGYQMPGSVRLQNRIARRLPLSLLWRYPNPVQRLLHGLCRVPPLLRVVAVGAAVGWWLSAINQRSM